MDDFQRDQLIVGGVAAGDEEERGVSAVYNLGVCENVSLATRYACWAHQPLYSRKLHMRVRRASTSWETSLTILALSLGARVVNHLARRYGASAMARVIQGEVPTTLPCRESRMRYLQLLASAQSVMWCSVSKLT